MSEKEQNGNGKSLYQLIGFILILFSVIAGIRSFVTPIDQRIENIEKEIGELKTTIKEIEDRPTRGAAEKLAAIDVKFTEVETQMKSVRELIAQKDEYYKFRIEELVKSKK